MNETLRVTHGPPGTGKTTYLAKMASEAAGRYGGRSILLASLTKAAAAEISQRQLPLPKDRIGTLHSHAYRALGCPDIAEAAGEKLREWERSTGFKVAHIKSGDDDGENVYEDDHGEPSIYEAYVLLRARLTPRREWPLTVQEFAGEWEEFKNLHDLIDFEDMIDHAYKDTETAPGNPHVIYIDEAQDHSSSEFRLAIKWAKAAPGGGVIVGDTDQTIYAWRGADPKAFQNLDVPAEHHRVLEQSYRVPRAVHATAQRIIRQCSQRDDITYHPRDHDGLVEDFSSASYRDVAPMIHEIRRIIDGTDETVMVLGACSYMLKETTKALRLEGLPFHNPFRKRRGDWNPLTSKSRVLDFLAPELSGKPAWTWKEYHRWIELIQSKYLLRGAKTSIAGLIAKIGDLPIGDNREDALLTVDNTLKDDVTFPGDGSAEDRLKWLLGHSLASKRKPLEFPARVFCRGGKTALVRRPRITVGTIHSVKGGEADHVFLFPDISSKSYIDGQESTEGQDGLYRLFYVGATRARDTLRVLRPVNHRYQMEVRP